MLVSIEVAHYILASKYSCQNVNWFFIFLYRVSYCIVYLKMYKHLIKLKKNYKYTYIKYIFIINSKYIQLMTYI